jgi:UDP-N-acetylglucosamine 2-epimerase (non-hydrolysing)
MSEKMKVMTVVGTRPEIIRLSRIMALLDKHVNHIIVHTGQNYDYELNEVFWEEMELRKPDHFLEVDTSSLGAQVGDIIRQSEKILKQERPDALLVLGDTNSCLSAYMAKRMHIPIFHMEAGNRCFDFNVPEEINRRIIDHIADYNLVYTEHARRHLLSEGLPHNRIYLTGSPMKEVLDYYKPKIDASKILDELHLDRNEFFLVSAHREENVDDSNNLEKILNILDALLEEYKLPVIVSTHPRTRKRIEDLEKYEPSELIRFMKPFGYFDYVHLQQNAKCVLSDSGTISEESAILSFPAVTIRNSMERPEAMDAGTIVLTGLEVGVVLLSIRATLSEFNIRKTHKFKTFPDEYKIESSSWIVIKTILGLSKIN